MTNTYLDASAIVKLYLTFEPGADRVVQLLKNAHTTATSTVSRAETVAALAKSARMEVLPKQEAHEAVEAFRADWNDLRRVQTTEPLVALADQLAWDHDLRGYDAVQLASGLTWKDRLGAPLTFATFDRQLWHVAGEYALDPFPDDLPGLLDTWAASDESGSP
jgi:predicted nucleic acid-binding protein